MNTTDLPPPDWTAEGSSKASSKLVFRPALGIMFREPVPAQRVSTEQSMLAGKGKAPLQKTVAPYSSSSTEENKHLEVDLSPKNKAVAANQEHRLTQLLTLPLLSIQNQTITSHPRLLSTSCSHH